MGLTDKVKAVDLFGYTIGFNVKGSDKIKTSTGAILSLLFTGCCLALVINSFISSLDKSNPTISQATFDKKPEDRIYINAKSPIVPVLMAKERFSNGDIPTTFTTLNMTEPMRRFHFELRWIKSFVNNKGEQEEILLGTGLQIMCSDLKTKQGAFYYPKHIEMSSQQRDAIEKLGVCFELPENIWFAQINETENIGFDLAVQHCHQRDDCYTDEKGALLFTLEGLLPRVSPDIYSLEKITTYKYSVGSQLSFTMGQGLKVAFSQLFEVQDEHVLLDSKKISASYQSTASSLDKTKYSTVEASLDYQKLTKCGTGDWGPYDPSLFSTPGCVSRTGFWCDKELKSINKLCYRFAGIFIGFDSSGQIAQKTVYVRKYEKVLDIFGSLGGQLSLVHQIFGFANLIAISLLNSDRVISMFFPIFKMKKLMKPEASKKLKQKAVEFIDDSLDVCNIIRDITCLRLLIDVLLDEPQKQLALVSSLQRFTNQNEASESSPVQGGQTKPADGRASEQTGPKTLDQPKAAPASDAKDLEQQIQSQVEALRQIRERSSRPGLSPDAQGQLKKSFDAVICADMASLVFESEAEQRDLHAQAEEKNQPVQTAIVRSSSLTGNKPQAGIAKGVNSDSNGRFFGNQEDKPLQDFELGEHKSSNQVNPNNP